MEFRNVIDPRQLPYRPPILAILVYFLLLDRFDAPGWLWGVYLTLSAILLIGWIIEIATRRFIKIKE